MDLIWLIYLLGLVVALFKCTNCCKEDDDKICGFNLISCAVLSLLSWVTVLALCIGKYLRGIDKGKPDE